MTYSTTDLAVASVGQPPSLRVYTTPFVCPMYVPMPMIHPNLTQNVTQ